MRLATVAGQACVSLDVGWVPVSHVTAGRIRNSLDEIVKSRLLDVVHETLRDLSPPSGDAAVEGPLGPPVAVPGAVFGWGLNFAEHASEAAIPDQDMPTVFVKFPAAINGPHDPIVIPDGCDQVDWEAELAVVIGRSGRRIAPDEAWDYVAGVCCAQDVSERRVQMGAGAGQFNLGKGYDTFCPFGPALVTMDEVGELAGRTLLCRLNGEVVQRADLGDLVTPVPEMLYQLSSVTTLRAGDVILCGSPAGVGYFREPQRFLLPGDVLETEISGVGALRNTVITETQHHTMIEHRTREEEQK